MSKLDCTFKSLLPHPTKVELALEEEMADKYCRSHADILRDLHNPLTCPLEFLPWLAYALSVDVWNPNWPEQIKRAVVHNSLMMHVHKGTIGGTEDAMLAFGIRPEIIEWWQQEPPGRRGTMQVTLWVNANLNPNAAVIFSKETIHDVIEQIERSKRASIHYAFRLAVEASPSGYGLASSLQAFEHQRTDALHKTTAVTASPPVNYSLAHSGQINTHQKAAARHTQTELHANAFKFVTAHSGQINTRQRCDALHAKTQTEAKPPINLGMAHSGQVNTHQHTHALHTLTAVLAKIPALLSLGSSGQMATLLKLEVSI